MLGAGPAGLAAALRLGALGHAVTLIERRSFPRPQIGEALSPGVPGLLRYLDAEPLLARVSTRADLDAERVWERPEPERMSAAQRGPGLTVDRGEFDLAMLELARARGIDIVQPTVARRIGASLELELDGRRITPAVVIDARGRAAPGPWVTTGAATVCLWVDEPAASEAHTRIEATPLGWLWGTPLPRGGLRTLAFVDRELARRGPWRALASLTERARLFSSPPEHARVAACDATARVAVADEPDGWLRAGDAAYCSDPLSSSGVERAMRSGLQAATAAHTLLGGGSPEVVATFLRTRTAEAVARHSRWTCQHYRSVHVDGEFWRRRADPWRPEPVSALLREIGDELGRAPAPAPRPISPTELARAGAAPLRVSPELRVVSLPCVVDDQIRAHPALMHPRLERPVAFVGGHAAAALLDGVAHAGTLRPLVSSWSLRMPGAEAMRIAAWMIAHGLIELGSSVVESGELAPAIVNAPS